MDSFSLAWQAKSFLLKGACVTVEVTIGAVIIGYLLGMVAGKARLSPHKATRLISGLYVFVFRGTPMLLQIFFVYFAIPQIWLATTGNPLVPDPVLAGIIALGINSGAYVAEIVRAGIQSVHPGQAEAARSLGMSPRQAMHHIVMPQALRKIIPPLGNEFIVLLKDSSLISVIGAGELMYSAKVLGARYYDYVQFLVGAALIYLTLTFAISQTLRYVENRLAASSA